MKVPDTIGMFTNTFCGIPSAESVMPGVEAQPNQARVGKREQIFYFRSGFHEARAVMVEHTPETRRVTHHAGNGFHAGRKHTPLLVAKTLFGKDAPCILGASRVF